MFLYQVQRVVDIVQHHQQVRGGTGCRSRGIQHEVVDTMIELTSLVVYVVDGFLVDADEHRVCQFDVLPLDDLIIKVLQEVLVVTDAVAHRLIGALHIQHRAQ